MLYLLIIVIFLFIITAIGCLTYFLSLKNALSTLNLGVDNLLDALKALKEGNLAKEIKKIPSILKIPFDKNINILAKKITLATKEFNYITQKPLKRLCYVGADSYLEGRICGKKMAELLNKKGEVAIIQIKYDLAATVLRQKGFCYICKRQYPGIRIVDIVDTYGDPEKTYQCVKTWLKKYPELKGIYIVEGISPPSAAKAVKESNRDIKVIGHDIDDEIAGYLKSGYIQASFSQNLFAQGYNPVIHLFNHLSSGWIPEEFRQLVTIDVITPENFREFWEIGKGLLVSTEIRDNLPKPEKASQKRIKILVSGDERYPIYMQIKKGVLEAKKELEQYNAEVDWIVPDQYLVPNGQILDNDKMIEFLKENMAKGYDALALMVNYAELVPYLNQLIDKGIPVASFNSDFSGLRGLVLGVDRNIRELQEVSEILNNSSCETNNAMQEISSTIIGISEGASTQSDNANEGLEAVKNLDISIQNLIDGVEKQTNAIKNSSSAGISLNNSIRKMMNRIANIDDIQEKVDLAVIQIGQIKEYSSEIVDIIDTINTISNQTNLLALNASIEAAHAGVHGKGFDIVADEIRKLSLSTSNATSDISKLIREYKTLLDGTSSTIEESKNVVDTEIKNLKLVANQMNESTEAYMKEINVVSGVIDKTTEAAGIMTKNSSKVMQVINEIVSVSVENSAASEEISATTIQISRHIESLAILASQLSFMANILQGSLFQFDLDSEECR